jgi:class 3 adenylate cyclase
LRADCRDANLRAVNLPWRRRPATSAPAEFQGVGAVLISEVVPFGAVNARISPAQLVELMHEALDVQERAIVHHGGRVEQFVGDSAVAYWLPAEAARVTAQAHAAAREIAGFAIRHESLTARLRAGFCVGECAGAYFGRGAARRFQVIGRARARANLLWRNCPGRRSGVALDGDTRSLLAEAERALFVPAASGTSGASGVFVLDVP